MFDRRGKILKHVRIGHAQSASVGKFRPDLPGLQLMCVNFWKNPGIVTLFDADGHLLAQEEPIHSGSPMLPVNWRGDGQEFVLLSGNAREGGMIDGHLRRAVMFPDDGHPDLTANVANLTGDARDEVILWDQERVWIYTQDRPFHRKAALCAVRNPDYNESNYRTVVSRPDGSRWTRNLERPMFVRILTTAVNIFQTRESRGNRGIPGVRVPPSGGPSIRFGCRLKAELQPRPRVPGVAVPPSGGPHTRGRCSPQWSPTPPIGGPKVSLAASYSHRAIRSWPTTLPSS